MKRSMKSGSFAIGLAMMLAPMVAAPGLAAADPATRPVDYQQITDVVIARGLSQRGVPFSWAGGGISGPTARHRYRHQHRRVRRLRFDPVRLCRCRAKAAAFFRPDVQGWAKGPAAASAQGRPDLLRPRRHAKRRVIPREGPDAGGGRRRPGFAGAHQRHDALPGPGSRDPADARPTGAGPASAGPASARPASARPTGARPTGAGPTGAGPASARPASARPAASLRHRALTLTVPLAFSPPKPASCFPLLSARSRRLVWVN